MILWIQRKRGIIQFHDDTATSGYHVKYLNLFLI